jgi:hypothetical protein
VFTAQKDFRLTDFTPTQCVLFSDLEKRSVVLAFDQVHGSSDGGAILLSAANQRFGDGLIESLSCCLQDGRQQGKVDHPLTHLMRQRIYGLACGYEDANDAARIGADPMHKLLAGRDPIKGLDLASQPTLSRFENSVTPRSLYMMGITLAESVITRHGKRRNGHARLVTIDMDPTDAATYGAQQLSFFNTHYDNHCYLPMLGFVSFDNEPDQYLCAAVLRPGNVGAATGAVGVLRRLIEWVRRSFPKSRIRVRLDGGFASPALFEFLDAEPKMEYVVGMPSNAVLMRRCEEAMTVARLCSGLTDDTEHVYGDTRYAAKSWKCERRVIFKAEVVKADGKEARDNRMRLTNAPVRGSQSVMDLFHGRRVWSFGSSSWPPGDSAAGCFVPEERDGAKRVLSQPWNGFEYAGPAFEEAVWRAAVEWEQHFWRESADRGGSGRDVGFGGNWEPAQPARGVVVQRPESGGRLRLRR